MKDMILFPEDIDRLNIILEQLTVKANLLLAVLINKDGRLLTFQGSLEKIDTVSMAALVAGNSASTLAIANLMGETEFSAMYHQGKDRHIYIAVVDENTFLCLVFDERTNIDRVKVFARQFDRQIKKALFLVYDKTEDQVDLDLDMGTYDQPSSSSAQSQNYQSTEQQQPALIKPESVNEPFMQSTPDISNQTHTKSGTGISPGSSPLKVKSGEEDIYYAEQHSNPPTDQISEEVHDTNYLYLKKKIRETVQRKKDR